VTGGRVDGGKGRDSIEMHGGDGADFIEVRDVEVIDIQLRAGRDRARLRWGRNAAGTGTVDGGSGQDFLTVMARSSVLVHLGAERVKVGPSAHLRAPGFKFAAADAPTVSMWGDSGGNTLFGYACDARLSGSAGPDRLVVGTAGRSCPRRIRQELRGNSGDDRLFGGPSDDVLLGGLGADRAKGYKGTDECDAEIEKSCER
jgi:Ca2+-binding RTX toxin-like protein